MILSKKKHFIFTLVFVIFILPVFAGSLLYRYHDYFHFKTMNHGHLVKPPIDAQFLYAGDKEKKWRVVYIAKNADANSQKTFYFLQQVQKALGKNADRVRVLQIANNTPSTKKLQVLFQQQEKNSLVTDKIYLMDPLGNLFMYYLASDDPMNILKDLKRVLEVSQIG